MNIKTLYAAALVVLLSFSASSGQEFKKTIMTGSASGTYIQIGKNLAEIGKNCNYTLDVVESAGSLENLIAVKKRTNTQFGIVQSDVLEYVNLHSASDPELRRSLYGVRIMFPLYNEEVHLLAKRSVQTISDLNGKKVAIGSINSGTFLTSTLVLDIMKVNNAERITVSSTNALPMLLAGQVDAFFYVAGAPAKLMTDPQIDGSQYHLVDLNDAALKTVYTNAVIPDGTYPFQPEPVNTVAVKATLMTYDYKPEKNVYHQQSCKAVSDLSNMILTHLDELKANGHPKWKDIDLTAIPPGWQVAACVKTGMAKDYKVPCSSAPLSTPQNANADQEYLNLLKQKLQE